MRKNKQIRMTLSFHEDERERYKLFRGVAREASVLAGKSESFLIVDEFLSSHLPVLSATRQLIVPLYSGERTMCDQITSVFDWLGSRSEVDARHSNAKPLVEFMRDLVIDWKLKRPLSQDEGLVSILETIYSGLTKSEKPDSSSQLSYFRHFIDTVKNGVGEVRTLDFYLFVLDNWNVLSSFSYTYRMLAIVTESLVGWQDAPIAEGARFATTVEAAKARRELATVLEGVMSGWNEDAQESMADAGALK